MIDRIRERFAALSSTTRALLVAGAVASAVVVVVGAAGWVQVRRAVGDLETARASIATAEAHARDADVDGVIDAVTDAERRLSSARATLRSSAPVRLARLLPGLRQNVDAAQAVTDRAFVLVASARRVADAARPLAGGDLFDVDGGIEPSTLEEIRATSASVRAELDALGDIDLPSPWMLLAPVEAAAADLRDGQRDYHGIVSAIDDGTTLVASLTGASEPSRWLIVGANAAEMRGAAGMPLSYAVLTGGDGRVEVSEVGHDEDLNERLVGGVDVDLPDDFRTRYDDYDLRSEFRNATISADFGVGGPVLAAMYEHATGTPVDGVIQVDSVALAELLGVTGPVSVDGVGELTRDNIVDVTLHQMYARFDANSQRQDALGAVSGEVVEHLLAARPAPSDLLDALGAAADGRHLMIYSSDEATQRAAVSLGVAGDLGPAPRSVHLAVENFSGNKLDYFVDTALDLRGDWSSDAGVTATVTVTNDAPPGAAEPAYVYGPASPSLVAGQYRGHVILYLPTGTSVVDPPVSPGVSDVAVGTENGRPVVTFAVDVFAGESRQVDIGLRMEPQDCPAVELVPSARIRPVDVTVDVASSRGRLSVSGPLSERITLGGDCGERQLFQR